MKITLKLADNHGFTQEEVLALTQLLNQEIEMSELLKTSIQFLVTAYNESTKELTVSSMPATSSVTLRRLIEEVALDTKQRIENDMASNPIGTGYNRYNSRTSGGYDRIHNRHNR